MVKSQICFFSFSYIASRIVREKKDAEIEYKLKEKNVYEKKKGLKLWVDKMKRMVAIHMEEKQSTKEGSEAL